MLRCEPWGVLKRILVSFALLFVATAAHAVPMELAHQGRLMDAGGTIDPFA